MHAADLAASVLGGVCRAAAPPARAVLRLWRLARLRGQCSGGVPVSTQFDGPVQVAGRPRLHMGECCRLGQDVFFETCGAGEIQIGARTRINRGTLLVAHAGIVIGDDCLIGEYVSIRDADHGTVPGRPMRTQAHTAARITIGADVWIARGAVILKGVRIGDGAVVAANSVVTRDVAPGAIVAGVPARVLRQRGAARAATTAEVRA